MNRPALIPFDPDALMQRGYPADAAGDIFDDVAAPSSTVMLSDLLASMEPTAEEQAKQWAAIQPKIEQGPGTSTPLDKRRRQQLGQLARNVWQRLHKLGVVTETCDEWRHRIATTACGRRISAATVGDFKIIQAAFLREAGQEQAAQRAINKAATTAVEIARNALRKALAKHGKTAAYAEAIAMRTWKRPLASINAKETWGIVSTVNNNGNAAAGKGNPANRFKSLKKKRADARNHPQA
ncbi:MAG: hypothetical protein V4662_13785 [Verrucomicrobiota bacterium]